jgi:diguanylate cyclase (GGDEF)-like protein
LVIGGIDELKWLIEKHQIGLILFALPDFSSDIKEGIAEICQGMNVRLVFMKELLKIIDTQLAQPTQYVGASLSKGNYQEGMPIYDPLTGLPNRQLFQDRVMHALAFGRRYRIQHMIVLINLNFPNSALLSLSSNIAYEVIKQAARRIKTCIRESDTLARFGQYEFALILENISEESSTSVVSRIQVILGKPFYLKERIIDLKTYTCIYQTLEDYAKSDRSVEFTRQAVFGSTREYLQ